MHAQRVTVATKAFFSLNDVPSLLKYYLGKASPAMPSWTFVDVAPSTEITLELVGVLRGDVDGSWVQA
jgi:hypothetical protein